MGRVEIRVREDLLCQCASHSLACRPLEGAAVRTEGRAASVLHQGCCAAGGCARNNNARPISSGLGFDAHHGSAADDAAASHHAGGGGLGIEGGVCGERMKRGGQCCCNPAPTFFRSALSAYFARPLRASALHAWSNGASMLMRQQPGITRGTGTIPGTTARAGLAAPPPLPPRIARRDAHLGGHGAGGDVGAGKHFCCWVGVEERRAGECSMCESAGLRGAWRNI